jgi:hypothetical protein
MAKEKSAVHAFPRHFSWSFLKTFCMPEGESSFQWSSLQAMQKKTHAALVPTMARYELLRRTWDRRLRPLGVDPSALAFDDFRPLRLSREEDWSDWLAWLLRTSETGTFAEVLFGQHMNRGSKSFIAQKVTREEHTEGRRADIVVTWESGQQTNIEVKIQDWQIEKTFETAMKLSGRSPKNKWYHFILVPDERMSAWDARARRRGDGEEIINALAWSSVVVGLRRCLWSKRESLVWRTWAWTFCGAVERHILHLSEPDKLRSDDAKLQMALSWSSLLDSTHEKTNAA